MRWAVAGVLVLALVIGVPGMVRAAPHQQAAETIRLLDTVNGTLDAATREVTYSFSVNADFIFSVAAWNRSGDLETELTVQDPLGAVVAQGQRVADAPTITVISAATAPADGQYTLIVQASGQTSGEFGLTLLPGYSFLDKWEDFEGRDDSLSLTWSPWSSEITTSEVVNSELMIRIAGSDTISYTGPDDDLIWGDAYVETDVRIEGAPSYYEYGFVLRMNADGSTFYTLTFSSDGDWSLLYYNGEWTTIQPWTASPVIDGADQEPHIGVFTQGNLFRLYFNDELVGEVRDENQFAAEGYLGLAAATTADQTDVVTAYFDDFIITRPDELAEGGSTIKPTPDQQESGAAGIGGLLGAVGTATAVGGQTPASPTPASGLPFGGLGGSQATKTPAPSVKPTEAFVQPTTPPKPTVASVTATPKPGAGSGGGLGGGLGGSSTSDLTNWQSRDPGTIVAELRQQGVVPAGGTLMMTIPTSFGDTSSTGFNYYPLGQGRRFGNTVIGFDAQLVITGAESACGMHFRNTSGGFALALVTEDGGALLAYVDANGMHASSVLDSFPAVNPGEGAVNNVIVTAIGPEMRMYVNGTLIGSGRFVDAAGTVALEVFVAEDDNGRTQRTYCQLEDIWLWEF
ncbi:MAG: hypothetical protein GXY36_13365 [Chloroflexi bacterium]|nr:hypothetical protein [Chloroflexota bacterium]